MAGLGTMTTPGLAATWRGRVADTTALGAELDRLWAEYGRTLARANGTDGAVLMRARTLNLIVVVRSTDEATRIEETIVRLRHFYPSRAILLVADPTRREPNAAGCDVRVALLEQPAVKGRPSVRFELLTIETDADAEQHVASIISPLLLPELPDFLWCPGSAIPDASLFDELGEAVDHLLVDTSILGDSAAGLRALADLIDRTNTCPIVSDFAWARLNPWRTLIAQFFDPPAGQTCLADLDEVAIDYAEPDAAGRSGLSGALLLTSWLASRLAWQAPGELVSAGAGWRLTLRGGPPGRRREIALTLRPVAGAHAPGGILAVTLDAHGDAAGAFRVERVDSVGVTTTSETATAPRVARMVFARTADDVQLLGDELRDFYRDPVFEEALTYAASLAPNGGHA